MFFKRVYAVVLAGGEGKRFDNSFPKQFFKIGEKSILEWAVEPFEVSKSINEIILVVNDKYMDFARSLFKGPKYKKISKFIAGGKTRQESSRLGLENICDEDGVVLIHDAVRPFVLVEDIERLITELRSFKAVTLAIPAKETIAFAKDLVVENIPPRDRMFIIQTPQGFHLSLIKEAHRKALEDGFIEASDDCSLILRYFKEENIRLVIGNIWNIKITYAFDLKLAQALLSEGLIGGT
ncbi:MAG: 2-C-methyl-D-erythritol 4-phosphate cytidylyltransferase [Synergistetes bacterium]|nr:2-C-methyl-D-erythritol 4-phosphate cytidylyltransferase [Synergistota bacterium]MCX8127852.1 2-C-methyl-D-erythritol 4-phosphate cytidylyltransferase [Synergistota bacterium]MDW8192114.1 2-C-methyl-D-erythritol 4-phosphate cytidylyltransferase [Synergistota bacterium]